jgi:hypothetical protein
MSMRLTDLSPRWYGHPDGRTGLGLTFVCPHCHAKNLQDPFVPTRLAIPFANPLSASTPEPNGNGHIWQRTGDTFETLTLTPSVDASSTGHWHGFITGGEVT